jgi:hypothetical protein
MAELLWRGILRICGTVAMPTHGINPGIAVPVPRISARLKILLRAALDQSGLRTK